MLSGISAAERQRLRECACLLRVLELLEISPKTMPAGNTLITTFAKLEARARHDESMEYIVTPLLHGVIQLDAPIHCAQERLEQVWAMVMQECHKIATQGRLN